MNKKLETKLKELPARPGVYFHKSPDGEVIYVGKAAVLKNRVRQYFRAQKDMDAKTQALVAEIFDVEWIQTESEIDALFLESEMVKRYKPRYNVLLRDDKSQIYVRIDMKSEWPSVSLTRHPLDDGATYYGPYYNGYAIKKALRFLRRIFPYYTKTPTMRSRKDLDSHIGLNPPEEITSEEYKSTLKRLMKYFEGGRQSIQKEIEKEMRNAASKHDFEKAASLRNRLNDLRELQQKIMFGDKESIDISKDRALSDLVTLLGLPKAPVKIEGFDISHMGGLNVVGSMVVFVNGVSSRSDYRKFKTTIEQNNDTANMKEIISRRLSPRNVKAWGAPDLILVDGGKGQLSAAIEAMKLTGVRIPIISIAKRDEEIIVHSRNSFVNTSFIEGVVKNPNKNIIVEKSGEFYRINLHPGQPNAGAHSRNLRGSSTPLAYSDVIKFFQRIRDESHRFAVSYHSVLKTKRQTESDLEKIPGVGPATRRKIIRSLGSLRSVKSASLEELSLIVGKTKAQNIKRFL